MSRLVIVTDDPDRSKKLANEFGLYEDCRIHNLFENSNYLSAADAFISDVADVGVANVARLSEFLGRVRRGAPLIVLLHQNSPRARLQAIALGATQTFSAPFDLRLLHAALSVTSVSSESASPLAKKHADAARSFYSTVFMPDRSTFMLDHSITPIVVDNGTELIGTAIQEVGIRDWVRAVRHFDDATHQHCLLVAGVAAAFAKVLRLGPLERHRVIKAALVHDVGKIHVPPPILNKPGPLSSDEMALVRLHPEQGYAMLLNQGFEQELLAVVRSHHEMLDGSGYPDKLRGEKIPDLVRFITVCDIFAALMERRSYKPPMTPGAANIILKQMVGRLDITLVNTFEAVVTQFETNVSCNAE